MLIWVTGLPGVGKSAVCKELVELGYAAFDADKHGFSAWRGPDGLFITESLLEVEKDPEFLKSHDWALRISRVQDLAATSLSGPAPVFLCGSVSNEIEVANLFDAVVALVVGKDILRYRLVTRTSNQFGKHPDTLAMILSWHDGWEDSYREKGAFVVDAALPVRQVALAVVAACQDLQPKPDGVQH